MVKQIILKLLAPHTYTPDVKKRKAKARIYIFINDNIKVIPDNKHQLVM